MKSLMALCFAAGLLFGCSSEDEEPVSNPGPGAATCTPDSQCAGCKACFDACLCGGGTAARCAGECGMQYPDPVPDSGTDAPAPAVGKYAATLVTEPFVIPPGEEFFKCQNFANPFGKNVAVLSTETFMTAGSHHLFVFQRPDTTDGPLESCSGLEFGTYLHSSQQSQLKTSYPPGIGRIHFGEIGQRVQIHYFNSSPDPVKVEIAVTIRADDPEAVPTLASQLFINTISIDVPAFSTGHAQKKCPVKKDLNLYATASHMHRHGTYFTARADDGQLLFETDQWEEPTPWIFDPPRRLRAGSQIQIDCDYKNDTPTPLRFGESADTNEMCILTGVYYPAGLLDAEGCVL
jgi:hypothetical protein